MSWWKHGDVKNRVCTYNEDQETTSSSTAVVDSGIGPKERDRISGKSKNDKCEHQNRDLDVQEPGSHGRNPLCR